MASHLVQRVKRGGGRRWATTKPVVLPADPRAVVYRRPGVGAVKVFHSSPGCCTNGRARGIPFASALAAGRRPCAYCWVTTCPHGIDLDQDCRSCELVKPEAQSFLRRVHA